ncbi:MAG: toprim domain-containing protein, partial [Gemmatimonadota bacterium]|nr:toprim domain-containing protein [Gemmatimonadota bacterium]
MIEVGKFYRCPGISKQNGNTSGWLKLFEDGLGGVYGDWASDFSAYWQAKLERPFSSAERDTFARHVAEAKELTEADKTANQAEAAAKAVNIWNAAQLANENHPYLKRKGIKANGARLYNGDLVIPLRIGSVIHSLQYVSSDGVKKFLPGGRVKGCYCTIGAIEGAKSLCIAEGFATGATIHEATEHPVVVAFNAGNLQAVTQTMREEFPTLSLIVCADDDTATSGNPGLTKATEAVRAVGGLLAIPHFGDDRPDGVSDFNDLYQHCGMDAVKTAISDAKVQEEDDSKRYCWPEPKPIQAPLRPVPAFDPETMLPNVLRGWIMDEADRMPCPPDFIAAGALVALGSVIGARCAIKSKSRDSWLIVPNLWGGIVAKPSAKKSPAIGAALKPLDR